MKNKIDTTSNLYVYMFIYYTILHLLKFPFDEGVVFLTFFNDCEILIGTFEIS